jgi:lysophospholipase L1-like esterase
MTLYIRSALFCLLVLKAVAQTTQNFTLAMESASISVAAGAEAALKMQVAAVAGNSQPIYLMPGGLPAGVSVVVPSPVVGGQTVKIQVRVATGTKEQVQTLAIYGAAGGQNRSTSFFLTVVRELPAAIEPMSQAVSASHQPESSGSHWVASWGASAVTPSNESGAYYLTSVTVRQVAHLSIGTLTGLRIRLSNALGRDPVLFGSVHAAQWAGNSKTSTSAIVPTTDYVVTFAGSGTVKIPGGEDVVSDPIALPLPAGADLAVSLYIPKSSNVPATMHTLGGQTAYFALGDSTASTRLSNAATDTVRPYLTGVDVDAPGASAVVVLGDSLTDGMLSALDQNLRWPDDLARRLPGIGVVNEGIAGNCVVMNCMGRSVPDRFKRDVLDIAGVKYLVLQAGANDIGNSPSLTVTQLAQAFQSIVQRAHAQNVVVYGTTIPPFGGSNYFTLAHERLRQEVNTLIRDSGIFDGAIDFDKTLADPQNPSYLRPTYNGDKLRPNDAGYQAMADAINVTLLRGR